MLIMTAILLPVLLLAMMGATTVMSALAKRQQLQTIAQSACNRAVKPLRMVTKDDATRQARAQKVFDDLARERNLTIASRTVTVGWLESRVTAKATVPVMAGYGKQVALTVSADESCAGIPPYPVLNEVVLSSNFKSPTGTAVDMPNSGGGAGRWGVFTSQQVGWDGGSGPGVELQDWKDGFTINDSKIVECLPPGIIAVNGRCPTPIVSSTFVVELDSYGNSSIFKNFELHPGTWEVAIWYRARKPETLGDTNKVTVYLEGTKPSVASKAIIAMDDKSILWQHRKYQFTAATYGLYRITIAAEGASDTFGGLFNDFVLTYVKRPAPEYND